MFPVIEQLDVKANFKYLWLKYVTGINLNAHCAKCLIGTYSTRIAHTTTHLSYVTLDENVAPYYYLCGVASPHKWANNFHLAFRFSPGRVAIVERNGIFIRLLNSEQISIVPINESNTHPKRHDRFYFTCRNWQFANMIAEEFNATH